MIYLVQCSGGSGSTVAGVRAMERFGRENVHWVFADTRAEHPSLYALLDEMERVLGIEIVRLSDGRDVWDVWMQSKMFTNPHGGCKAAEALKMKPLDRYRDENFTPDTCTIVVGMDATEPERMARLTKRLAPWPVIYPLTWSPMLGKCDEVAELERLGLSVPELYQRGHRHNNCAGACVLAGSSQWAGLLQDDPERFYRYAQREQEWRATTGKDFSILRDRRYLKAGEKDQMLASFGVEWDSATQTARSFVTQNLTLMQLAERALGGERFREWRSTCGCMNDGVQQTIEGLTSASQAEASGG